MNRIFAYRPRYYLLHPHKAVKELWNCFAFFNQRGKHGWAVCDNWNFDTYIARLISEMLAYSANHKYGVPAPYEMENPNLDERYEHWIAHVKELSQAFREYVEFMESDAALDDTDNKRYEALLIRMRPLLDYWFYALGS